MSMSDDEFNEFLGAANTELRQKQDVLRNEFGLGTAGRWWFEQSTGNLQFFDAADNLVVEADVIDVGSYSTKSNSWKWAWSNDSVLPWLRQRAQTLRELEDITGVALFGYENAFGIDDESMAWELTAMAVKYLGAMGCYRAPSSIEGGPTMFLAIMAITKVEIHAP